jgi:hypothetical protein
VIHHRRLRKQGGKDTPENLIHICVPCHTWIHHNVALAAEWGLLLRTGDEP